MPVFSEMQMQKDASSGHDGEMTSAQMMAPSFICTSCLKASSAFVALMTMIAGCMFICSSGFILRESACS